jgi:ABC-type multidrug transport system ATPase subunit
VDIRFIDVSVELAGKLRLHGVSMGVKQGELVGLLGPSASGKSTLLRALAGHLRMAGGDIYINGRSVSRGGSGQWHRGLLGFGPDTNDVGFVQQIDLIQAGLTVREILQFAARQMGLGAAEARERSEKAGQQCNLGPLMDRVAISGNGQMNLSGGQLKRVCVGIEVLRGPRVLVLDEPTTGQDPKNTKDLMDLFRRLTRDGVTVLMSTHDLGTLDNFDKVTALCLGHLAYFGPPAGFAPYFNAESAEAVYASLPDREERLPDAARLAQEFKASPQYRKYCGGDA